MILKLARQVLKPFKRLIGEPEYREWLRLHDKLRNSEPGKMQVINAAGYRIKITDAGSFLNQYENIFLNQDYFFPNNNRAPLIIDCGANIGLSVLYFKKLNPEARIIAFEPDPHLFSVLEENIRINHITGVELRKEAVWINNGEVSFESSLRQDGRITESGNTKVKSVRIKDFLHSYEEIDLLKIDIEGAEAEVIPDCGEELIKVKHLFLEYHQRRNEPSGLSMLLGILEKNNLTCLVRTCHSDQPEKRIASQYILTYDISAIRNFHQDS